MATEAVASDHTSTTDEQFEKVKEEAIGKKSASLSHENEGEVDKAEDQKPEGDEKKAELDVVEVENSDNCPALEASVEDNLKHDKVEDAQGPSVPFSKTEEAEGDENNAESVESDAVVEKIDDYPSSEASDADNLREEKEELVPDSQTINVTEPAPNAAKSQAEEPPPTEPTESTETGEEKQPKAANIPEASAGTAEKSSNKAEANPPKESEAEALRETEDLETSSQDIEKPEPVVTETEVQQQSEEPKKESQHKANEAEQPNTVVIPDPSAEINEKPSDAIDKPEPVVTEEPKETPQEAEQSNTVAIPELSTETNEKPSDAVEEKTKEPEFDAEVLKESNSYEARPEETEKAEHMVTENEEKPSEPEKQSFEKEEEEQQKTAINDTEIESAKQPGGIVEVHPPQESDIEVVNETGNSESEAVHVKEEKPELVSTEVEEKPREQLDVAEEIGKTGKNAETEQETVLEPAKSNGTSDDTIKQPISPKEEKADKEEGTGIPGNSAQVSLNEEAQAAPANPVESSPPIAEKAVEEDATKDEIQGLSKEGDGVLKSLEQASIIQEDKTDLKEERKYSAAASVEEKVAANDDKKQPSAPDVVEGSTREAAVEIKKVEEKTEAKTATKEAEGAKVKSVKDDRPEVDNRKEVHPDTKASKLEAKEEESIKTGVHNMEKVQIEEQVKTGIQIPEPPSKGSDATKTSKELPKETPVKPAQKQSNNIISKVKQSLVKAKKAITGKSPSSKTLSSEAKGDIKVK